MVGILGMSTGPLRLLAKTISFLLALTSNFIWNRYWIYPESRSKRLRVQVAQFSLVNVLGLALNLLIFGGVSSLLIPFLQGMYGPRPGLLLGTNAGQVCSDGENVGKVHLERIIRHFSNFKCWSWGGW